MKKLEGCYIGCVEKWKSRGMMYNRLKISVGWVSICVVLID